MNIFIFFEVVATVLANAFQDNLIDIFLMELTVALLFIINIWLGTIIGTKKDKFDWKKFLWGIFKAINILLIIFILCYALNLFVLVIERKMAITIDGGYVTTIEIFGIIAIWGVNLANDIKVKIKSFNTLKYVSYEAVHYNEGNGVVQ